MFDANDVERVRDAASIADVIGEHVPLRRVGASLLARCPFHDDRTPSFNVHPDRGFYFCFGCKATGDVFSFVREIDGLTFPEAVEALAERFGVELPERRSPAEIAERRRSRDLSSRLFAACEAATSFFERCLLEGVGPGPEAARAALEARGIPEETRSAFRLGYAPASWDALALEMQRLGISPADAEAAGLLIHGDRGWHDRFRHRLMFPVMGRDGRALAFSGRILPTFEGLAEGIVPAETGKYINSPETPIYRKGECLYGLSVARQAMRARAEAILVEGNFDVVSLHAAGFRETVGVLGTSFTEAQGKLLRRYAEVVRSLFDGDDAGRRAVRAALNSCAKPRLTLLVSALPQGEDPDSFVRTRGVDALRGVLERAIGAVEWLIVDQASTAGESVPRRVDALRAIAQLIASVPDVISRALYADRAAGLLTIKHELVVRAVTEAMAVAREAARGAPEPAPSVVRSANEEARRAGASLGLCAVPEDQEEARMLERSSLSAAVTALLIAPDVLATSSAETLSGLAPPSWQPFIEEALSMWASRRALDGPTLLERAPGEKARAWVATRLLPPPDGEDGLVERHRASFAPTVSRLAALVAARKEAERAKQGAARGVMGEPEEEVRALQANLLDRRQRSSEFRDGQESVRVAVRETSPVLRPKPKELQGKRL